MEMNKMLKVRYNVWPPWAMTTLENNQTALEGVFKDVFGALSQSMKYKFLLELQPDKRFGSLGPNGSFSGMMGALQRKEADLAAPLIGSEERSVAADFTNYLEISTLGIITGIEEDEGNTVQYTKILSWQVVLSLLSTVVVLILFSSLIYMVHLKKEEFDKCNFLVSNILMWCKYLVGKNSNISGKHVLVKIWHRVSFRILLAAWLLGPVVNLIWTFQGSITSTFAVMKLKPVIGDLEELEKKLQIIPVTTKGSAVEICFRSSLDHYSIWERMENHTIDFTPDTIEKIFRKIEKRTHILIVDYVYALVITSNWLKNAVGCKVQVEQLDICKSFISLALRKGLKLDILGKINSRLNYIIQAKLTDRWMNRVFNNYTHCSKKPLENIKPLDFSSFRSIFIFWTFGVSLSLFCFSLEIALNRIQQL